MSMCDQYYDCSIPAYGSLGLSWDRSQAAFHERKHKSCSQLTLQFWPAHRVLININVGRTTGLEATALTARKSCTTRAKCRGPVPLAHFHTALSRTRIMISQTRGMQSHAAITDTPPGHWHAAAALCIHVHLKKTSNLKHIRPARHGNTNGPQMPPLRRACSHAAGDSGPRSGSKMPSLSAARRALSAASSSGLRGRLPCAVD